MDSEVRGRKRRREGEGDAAVILRRGRRKVRVVVSERTEEETRVAFLIYVYFPNLLISTLGFIFDTCQTSKRRTGVN